MTRCIQPDSEYHKPLTSEEGLLALSLWERVGRGLSAENDSFYFVSPVMQRHRHYRGGYQSAALKDSARDQRQDGTQAEYLLWQLLRKRQLYGFKFRRQHQYGDYILDFYCDEARLAVECDGAVHNSNEQWQHDQKRDAYITSQGLLVLRFTNQQVLHATSDVLDKIAKHLPEKQNE